MRPYDRKIKVCFFPGRESSYARSRVLIKGLRDAGLLVYDCSSAEKSVLRYVLAFLRFFAHKGKSDIIFIGFFGQPLVPIVRIFTRKKIIFDTFLSAYQTLVFDRTVVTPDSVTASIIRSLEKLSCQLADACLLDTDQHIDYFVREYQLDRAKFRRSFLGAEPIQTQSMVSSPSDRPIIHFHGEFQALHGVKFIIGAAKILPEIKFRLIGSGRERDACIRYCETLKAENVEFIPALPFDSLMQYLNEATISLGIFGETEKTNLVIPFKVYESLAAKKPIITADTPAIRELLTHGQDVFLCKRADSNHLAWAIQKLLNNENLRRKIADEGYQTFLERCAPSTIGREIADLCEAILRQ